MREILTDLVKEQQTLDQFLQKINPREWGNPTKAKGWSIKNLVAHLAQFEDLTADTIEDDVVPNELIAEAGGFEAFVKAGIDKGKPMRPQDVIEWWRLSRARAMDALWSLEADDRVEWVGGDCSARTLATYRIMETWAHGLDVWDIWGNNDEEDMLPETERLKHIIFLSSRVLPVAFKQAGESFEPVRIEAMGPNYAKWSFGPVDAPRIKGPAMPMARYVVQRSTLKQAKAEGVVAEGEAAEKALELLTAYVTG